MAVVGFWPVYGNLKAALDYADNPDKTTAKEYLDDDLYAALRYTENDNKTDRKMYVAGINCSKQNAYAEMIAVQRRFGLRAAEKDLKAYISDYHFLQEHNIRTIPELQNCITETQDQITDLETQRNKISNQIRRPKSPEEQSENKEQRKAITNELTPLHKEMKQAEILKNLRIYMNY